MTGKIRMFEEKRGFGFIVGEDGKDYFFHFTALKNIKSKDVRTDMEVTFEAGRGPKGPRAEEVYV